MNHPKKRLDAVAEILMGQAPPGESYNLEGDGWPLLAGAGDFKGDHPVAKKFTTEASRISIPGDIVIGVRASIGDKVIADQEYCLGRGVAALRARSELHDRYLWHWLSSVKPSLEAKGKGATFKQVTKEDIAELEIPLPPLEEQRRIAAILDASHKLQQLHRQRVEGLFGLRQSMYRQLFGLPGSELQPLSSLVKITSGYAFKAADFCSQGVHIIRMSDLNGEDVDLASSVLVPAEAVEGLERFELFEGDILLGMSGSLGKLGIVPCIPAGTRAFLNQRVAKISLLPKTPISRELLVESIKSREYIAHLERCAAGVAVRNVSAAQMLDFAIPVPSAEAALSFSEACKRIGTQIIRSEQCIKQSSELQASLVETFIGKT